MPTEWPQIPFFGFHYNVIKTFNIKVSLIKLYVLREAFVLQFGQTAIVSTVYYRPTI